MTNSTHRVFQHGVCYIKFPSVLGLHILVLDHMVPLVEWSKVPVKIHMISNPKSGTFQPKKTSQAIRFFRQAGISCKHHRTEYPGHAEELLEKLSLSENDIVAVCGGDGTLNEVINAMAGRGVRVGLIPMGTANIVALQFGIPRNTLSACKNLLKGKAIPYQVNRANDRYFVFTVSAGADSVAVHEVNLKLKQIIGKGAYVVSFFKSLLKGQSRPIHIRKEDGPEELCFGVIVGTIALYAGRFKLFPNAYPQNGKLHCCIFKSPSRARYLLSILMIISGLGSKCPWVEILEVDRISLSSEGDYPMQIDGCPRGNLPVVIDQAGTSIPLIVPLKTIDNGRREQ